MRVLIVENGVTRGALAATRALARQGWFVGIGSPRRGGLAASSRFSSAWHPVPAVEDDLDAFISATNAAIDQGNYEVVFPSADAEALALSYARDRIGATVPYPPHETVLRAFDKLDLLVAADRVGIATPRTTVATPAELEKVDGPVVVKSRLHWTPGSEDSPARLEASVCDGRAEAELQVAEMQDRGGTPLLQEFVGGRMVHYICAVDREGHRVAEVQTLAAPLAYPPGAGMRVRSTTVPVDEKLADDVSALLAELRWTGLASLMFLAEDGRPPMLVDFNGRFVASFDASLAAGPNFAAIWAAIAVGIEPPPSSEARTGVRFQWLEGDLRRAVIERRGGLVRDVAGCLAYAPGAKHTLLKAGDPWPMVRFIVRLLKRGLAKLIRSPSRVNGDA